MTARSRWLLHARDMFGTTPVAAVLIAGLVLRAVLVPLTHGQDFVVWDRASAATLDGVNIYAHHPGYPGGPYAYFPLFVDIELPLRWLAYHTGATFTILGKLPIVAGDVAVAAALASELRRRGHRPLAVAVGVAGWFLNPLVLYNGAYYGRFDSLCCALLLLALSRFDTRSRTCSWYYALAVAAKTFPVFLLPGVLQSRRGARAEILLAGAVVLGALSLPYLSTVPSYLHDIVVYDAEKTSQGLSWQHLLPLRGATATTVGFTLLAGFVAGAYGVRRLQDRFDYAAVVLILFLVCNKVVLEQYLLWPLPFLIVQLGKPGRVPRWAVGTVIVVLTAVGTMCSELFHPWGRSPWPAKLLLLLCCAGYLLTIDHTPRRRWPLTWSRPAARLTDAAPRRPHRSR